MTASVQGMSTKQSSRALVNLFYPLMSIPSIKLNNHNLNNLNSNNYNINNSSPSSSLSPIREDGNNFNDNNYPNKVTQLPPLVSSFVNQRSGSYSSTELNNIFISDEAARPWEFTYFHKSGMNHMYIISIIVIN